VGYRQDLRQAKSRLTGINYEELKRDLHSDDRFRRRYELRRFSNEPVSSWIGLLKGTQTAQRL
jgi:hypothetical protein